MHASLRAWAKTLVSFAAAFVALWWVCSPPASGAVPAHLAHLPPPRLTVRVVDTWVCGGVLTVAFDAVYRTRGRPPVPRLDDGWARLELLDASGRSAGPGHWGGSWRPVATRSGGEGRLRDESWTWEGQHGLHWRQARVVVAGVRSRPVKIETRCLP